MTTQTMPYLVTLARDHTLKVHRSTCRKALANANAIATDQFDHSMPSASGGRRLVATPATCCKPRPLPGSTTATTEPETPQYEPHPGRRAQLALEESKALRAAKRAGEPLPATPNLDKVNAEYASGIDAAAREQLVAEYEAKHGGGDGTSKRRAKVDVAVRFVRGTDPDDLKPMPDSQNKLASVAYYHTRDVEPGVDRITTAALRTILANEGVDEPEAEPWGPITLPNGVVLAAVAL